MPRGKRADPAIVGRGLALLDAGVPPEQIAVELGVPRRTIAGWSARHRGVQSREEHRDQREQLEASHRLLEKKRMRTNYVQIVALAAERMLEGLSVPGKVSANAAAYIGGVAFDKVRLLDNEPTAITADADLATFLGGTGYAEARGRVVKLRAVREPDDSAAS